LKKLEVRVPTMTEVELGEGRGVEAEFYAIVLPIEDRERANFAVTFEGRKTALGVRPLEGFGLMHDGVSWALGGTRPAGVA